jgi:DHA3 family tetracycline resistance protein-like MFS transporter
VLVGTVGAGAAFAVDAATFLASAVAVVAIRPPAHPRSEHVDSSLRAVKEGFDFVRCRVWLWGTLLSAAIAYLAFMGPAEVLLPYVVKNDLHASARDLGLMYACWTLATLAVAGYGFASASWQLMLACLLFNALETAGTIVWATIKQRHVPPSLLGRVSSLDWMISIGLLPLSFALTAPIAAAAGARATLIGAAAIGGLFTLAALFLPGMRDLERTDSGMHAPPRRDGFDVRPDRAGTPLEA